MKSGRLFGLLLGLALPAMADNQDEELKRHTEDVRKVAAQLLAQIRGEVTKEMEQGGPLRSVIVCKYSVPEITSSLSRKSGMRVSRVTLKARNPALAAPDPWEQRVLMDFDKRVTKGEKADTLEFSEVVAEPQGRFLRYMKAIPVAPVCTTCHGAAETLTDAIKAQLATEYPHDKATGYSVGQVRGAVTVKRAL
jgi:hypothetical protein